MKDEICDILPLNFNFRATLHYFIVLCARLQKMVANFCPPIEIWNPCHLSPSSIWFELFNKMQPNIILWVRGWVSGELVHFLSALSYPALHSKWVVLVLPAEGWESKWNQPTTWATFDQIIHKPIWKLTPDKLISPAEFNQPWPDKQNFSVEPSANWQCIEFWA